jgi:AcrR family transcriptional regulator
MPPRPYNNESRQQQQAELKARIAAAAAELHAAQGALATSYAQVAQQAGVSLPTVYKHYPTLDELLQACTSHVAERAPAFPHDEIVAAPDLEGAAALLVEACDALHAYYEPWLGWREHTRLPVLQHLQDERRRQLLQLARAVLQTHGVPAAPECAALWESLLSFDFWQRLVREHKLPRVAVRSRQLALLMATAASSPTPSSKKASRK